VVAQSDRSAVRVEVKNRRASVHESHAMAAPHRLAQEAVQEAIQIAGQENVCRCSRGEARQAAAADSRAALARSCRQARRAERPGKMKAPASTEAFKGGQ
jgi:hypothetical protein